MATVIGSLRAELSASVAQFQTDLGKAADSVESLSKTFTSLANDFKKTGAQIESIGTALTKTLTIPLAGLAAAATAAAVDVESGFNTIRAATGATGDRLMALEQSFSTVFKGVPDEAKTVADAMSQISIRTGLVGKPLEDLTTQLVNLGHITKSSIQPLADGITRAFGDWSIATVNQSSAMDFLFKASEKTGIGIQNLTDLIVQFGAPLRSLGFSFEQSAALLGKFQAEGVNVETVLAGMRFALGKFAAAGKDPAQAFKDVQQAILGAGNQAEATKIAFDTFGRRAATDMARAIIEGRFAIDDLVKSLRDSHETINSAAEDTRTFSERWKELSHSVEVALEPLGNKLLKVLDGLRPALESAAETLGKVVTVFLQLPQAVQNTAIGLGVALAALGPLTFLFGDAVKAIGVLIGAFGKTGVATRGIVGALSLGEKALGAFNSAIVVDGALLFEWGKGTVAVGGLVGRLGAVLIELASTAFGPLAVVVEVVGAAFAAIVSPIGLVIAAVVAIGLGVVAATGHWSDFTAAVSDVVGVVKDAGTVLLFLAQGVIADLVTGLVDLAKWLGGGILSGFQSLVSIVQALLAPFEALAATIAGPVIAAFKEMVAWVKDNIPAWLIALIVKIEGVAVATKDLAVEGAKHLHDYATAVRDAAKDIEQGFQQATKALDDYRQSVSDRAIPAAVMDIGKAFALLKSQLSGLTFGGSNGFQDLLDSLKAARAELAALSSADLARLTEAVNSGAFSMKEIAEATGLSDMALKLFQEQLRETAKEAKAANSIFAEFDKQQAQAITALTEGFSAAAPIEFIKKAFGSLIAEVVEKAGALGKQVPDIIKEGFLQITLKDAADHMVKELAEFGKKLNEQVKADLDKRNDQIIKALGASVDAQQQAAEAASQFSIQGLANQIKNIETVYGETKKSIDLKKQLYAEEYLYQVELLQKAAQAEKDGLDKKVGDYTGAYARIDAAVAAKVGLLSQNYQQKLTEMRLATKKWQDSLADIAGVFSDIASASDGSFSSVLKDLGNLVSSLDRATKAAKAFQAASAAGNAGGQFAAAGQGIAAVAQATSSKSVAASVIGGAITGAQLTAGLGYGAIIGAGVGALVGYIRAIHKGAAEKAALDVGRDFGIAISDGLAKELADLGKGIGRQAANIFDLDKIIAEGGGLKSANIKNFTSKLHDTFSLLGTGALTAADATHVLDSNFANFANYFLAKGPLISKDLVDIVKLTREWGLESKAVSDFIANQIDTNIIPGLGRFTTASKTATDALAENQKKLADLQGQLAKATDPSDQADLKKQIDEVTQAIANEQGVIAATAVTSQGAADALAASVLVAFNEMQKAGVPVLDIVTKLAPIVAQLGQQFAAAGFDGGAAFDKLRGIMALASDEIAGPAIDAATGLGQALAGLSNIGQLDQNTFTGLSDQIAATFDSLVAQGKDGNQVLALMKGPLQTIWQLQQEFGYSVDEATQALLDQAVAAGVVGETQKPIQEQMLDATKAIAAAVTGLAKVFGVDLPEAGKTGADKLKDEFEKLNPKVKVDIQYNDPGFTPDVTRPTGASTGGMVTPSGIQHFAWGGFVRRGTDTVPAMLTPGELVLNRPQQAAISSALAAVTGMADFGSSGSLAVLRGRESVVTDDQIAAMRKESGSRPVEANGDTQHFNFSLYAYDASGLQRLVTKPGGLADVLVTATSQGKRGLDEKFRRALRVPG